MNPFSKTIMKGANFDQNMIDAMDKARGEQTISDFIRDAVTEKLSGKVGEKVAVSVEKEPLAAVYAPKCRDCGQTTLLRMGVVRDGLNRYDCLPCRVSYYCDAVGILQVTRWQK